MVRLAKNVTINGVTRPLSFWLELFEINSGTFYKRLYRGWSIENAIAISPHRGPRLDSRQRFYTIGNTSKNLRSWCVEFGVSDSTLIRRLDMKGVIIEDALIYPIISSVKGTRERKTWYNARERCTNESHPQFRYFGGDGLLMCDSWLNSFAEFLNDMGSCNPLQRLCRKNSAEGFSPNNCEWR